MNTFSVFVDPEQAHFAKVSRNKKYQVLSSSSSDLGCLMPANHCSEGKILNIRDDEGEVVGVFDSDCKPA
ncbi:hypothetical protein CHISP_0379 [Chitinispirillum alkaliphilum]|nr:hypothetical protein CHISP_0379 [Chitinispirillum alkaliphilum]